MTLVWTTEDDIENHDRIAALESRVQALFAAQVFLIERIEAIEAVNVVAHELDKKDKS